MTTPERVNPEVVLKAWHLTYNCDPPSVWDLKSFKQELLAGRPCVGHAFALERALKKEGFDFGHDGELFYANHIKRVPVLFSDDYIRYDDLSDTLLLLKCVAAMHNLSLYTIVSQDGVEGLGK